jgi:hypothetical protein
MASLEQLERRIQALEDIDAIKELKHRYMVACDRQRPDDMRECFDTGEILVAYEGFPPFTDREPFVKVFRDLGCKPNIMDMHHVHNPVIKLTGPDTAKATWELFFVNIDMIARTQIQMACEYHDEYVKKNGRWLIKKTVTTRSAFTMTKVGDDGVPKLLAFGKPPEAPFGAEPGRKG